MILGFRVSLSRALTVSTAVAALALIQGVSCASNVSVSNEIGPAGGTVSGPNGVQVVIPPGALTQPTAITITAVPASAAPAAPGGLVYEGDVYAFEPHGLAFAAPVEVRLPVTAAKKSSILHASCAKGSAGASQCAAWDAPLGGVTFQPGSASFSTSSFSLYAAAEEPGDGGTGGTGGTGGMTTTSSSSSSSGSTSGCMGASMPSSYPVTNAPADLAVADLNGDGKPDLVATNGYGNGNAVNVLLNKGDGTFAAAVQYPLGAAYNQFVAAGDLNGDGKPDLVVINSPNSPGPANRIDVLLNKGDGTFGSPISTMAGSKLLLPAVADVNGDGKPDVLTTDGSSLLVLPNTGGGTLGAPASYPIGSLGWQPVVADLDGDGKPDVAVVTASSVSVLRNVGGGAFAAPVAYPAGSMPNTLAVADLDGDGKLDLAVADQGSGVLFFRNKGNGTFDPSVNIPVGTGPFSVAAGDLDSDGNVDLVVTLWSDSTLRVFWNAGDATFSPGPVTMVGPAPEGLVLADLDGDGKLDGAFGVAMGNTVDVMLGLACQ